MKIYGNAQSDRFGLFLPLAGGVFVGGGFLIANVGALMFLVAFTAFVAVCAAMIVVVRRYDVMSEAAAPSDARNDAGVPVRMPSFPVPFAMKADTEAVALTPMAAVLPIVDKPKSAVETNTAVA
ncbi:MAG TPA: hypothetical protein VGO62_02385 [Myxococcota bacterium]